MNDLLAVLADGATVVTANNRLARNLRIAFDRRQQSLGHSVWPSARVLPWKAWLGGLWESSFIAGGTAGRRDLLTDFQAGQLWQRVIDATPSAAEPGNSVPIARLSSRSWALAQAWRIGPDTLIREADSADSEIFARWAHAFVALRDELSWIDPAGLPELLHEDLQAGTINSSGRIHLAGFQEPTPQQLALVAALSGAGASIEMHAPSPQEPGAARRVDCHDRHHELELAARWARGIRESQPAARVAVVIPDLASRSREVMCSFRDVFIPGWYGARKEFSAVNLSYGEPLADAGIVHAALLTLGTLRGRLDYRDLGQLLRSSFIRGAAVESSRRAALDLRLREQPGQTVSLDHVLDEAKRAGLLFGELFAAAHQRATSGTAGRMPGAWSAVFSAYLRDAGWPGDEPPASSEYQALHAWQDILAEFAASDRILGRLPCPAALDVLMEMVRERVFQREGDPDAVQVLGLLEALNQDFDALWICGLTSDQWPPFGRPDPLLPLGLQRRLGLPDSSPARIRERAERQLRQLFASAREVWCSWPRSDGDEIFEPSPLIDTLPAVPEADVPAFREATRREQLFVMRPAIEWMDDPAPTVAPTESMRGGTGLLAMQARCPARAFFEMRLGAREMTVPAPGIVPRLRGQILHAVLAKVFPAIQNSDALRALTEEELSRRLLSLLELEISRQLPPTDRMMREMGRIEASILAAVLGEFVAQERRRPSFEVCNTEQDAIGRFGELSIHVRPDRIDRLADGRLLVIDYKTGDFNAGDWLTERPAQPQLPAYASLFETHAIAAISFRPDGVRWTGIGESGIDLPGVREPGALPARYRFKDWQSMRGAWQQRLERLAAEIVGGDARIHRFKRKFAEGQWSMLTRVHEMPDEDDVEIDE